MKRMVLWMLIALIMLACTGCTNKNAVPDRASMGTICELATMRCFYHNVIKVHEQNARQFLWLTYDKDFWIEYEGNVEIGIDADRIAVEVDGNKVYITIPPVEVLGGSVNEETFTEESFAVAKESVEIKAEDQLAALAEAEAHMKNTAANDSKLLEAAKERAKRLIADYIDNLSNAIGKKYEIYWIELDDSTVNATT